jgi:MFS transporter, DHA1 family, multidrug resistance protein
VSTPPRAPVPPSTDLEQLPAGRILFWMCVLILVNQLGFGALIPVLPLYAQSFGVSQFDIGLSIAVYGAARFVFGVPTGQMADWLGRRPTLAIGGLVSALGNGWSALATSYPEFVVARFVSGGGAALVLTAGSIVLADISTPERRGRTMALYQGTFLFAVGVGPLPGGLLAEHFGLGAPFWVYSGMAVVAGFVAWFAVAETRSFGRNRAAGSPKASMRSQLASVMRISGFRLVCSVGFVHALTRTGALFAIVPILGRDSLNLSAAEIGSGMALGSILGLLITYPAGALADRYGRKAVIVPATLTTGCAMALFALAPNYAWFICAFALWGVASAAGGSGPAAYAADCAPPGSNAAAMSAYRSLSDMGYVIGPLVLGLLADMTGAASAMYVSSVLLLGVGLTFARFATETHRSR